MIETEKYICPREDVAAYLDGELDGDALERFESHVAECKPCASELRRQRQLVCTLDAAFNSEARFDLPAEFTRAIAAHAESELVRSFRSSFAGPGAGRRGHGPRGPFRPAPACLAGPVCLGISRARDRRRSGDRGGALLGLAAFALLGAASSGLLFQPARNFLRLFARVLELFWRTSSDATESLGIILHVLARGAIGSPYIWPALIGLTLIVAVSLLSRLIGRYHRNQIIE